VQVSAHAQPCSASLCAPSRGAGRESQAWIWTRIVTSTKGDGRRRAVAAPNASLRCGFRGRLAPRAPSPGRRRRRRRPRSPTAPDARADAARRGPIRQGGEGEERGSARGSMELVRAVREVDHHAPRCTTASRCSASRYGGSASRSCAWPLHRTESRPAAHQGIASRAGARVASRRRVRTYASHRISRRGGSASVHVALAEHDHRRVMSLPKSKAGRRIRRHRGSTRRARTAGAERSWCRTRGCAVDSADGALRERSRQDIDDEVAALGAPQRLTPARTARRRARKAGRK
jgi:hypothetical protein